MPSTLSKQLSELFNTLGDFAFRALFKPINVTPELQRRRVGVLYAIIDAGPADWYQLTKGQQNLVLAVLKYEMRRVEGTWVGEQGRSGRLRFNSEIERQQYKNTLLLAIDRTMKALR